jgi:hypothetical protein
MSLNTFKRKSVINYGSKRSGKPPGGYWLPQGPFGASTVGLQLAIDNYGPVGFSLNGPHRNIGYIGKESKFSKNGTPFRGLHPYGWGGHLGRYARPEPVFNVNEVIVLGDQYKYVKQSVLSTKGMLQKKYRWAYNGQYPNYWVQPVQDGTMQSDNKSQGLYLHNLSTANDCITDVNDSAKYIGYIKRGGPTLCQTSTARFKYNDMARNGLYTKTIKQPITASQQTLRIQRKCANPLPSQKPFPYAVNTGTGILTGGINVTSVGNSGSYNNLNITYNTPTPAYEIQPSTVQ